MYRTNHWVDGAWDHYGHEDEEEEWEREGGVGPDGGVVVHHDGVLVVVDQIGVVWDVTPDHNEAKCSPELFEII